MSRDIIFFVFNDYEEDLKLVINIVMQSTQIILLMFRMGMWKLLKKNRWNYIGFVTNVMMELCSIMVVILIIGYWIVFINYMWKISIERVTLYKH
jgi:hypothetical protein